MESVHANAALVADWQAHEGHRRAASKLWNSTTELCSDQAAGLTTAAMQPSIRSAHIASN